MLGNSALGAPIQFPQHAKPSLWQPQIHRCRCSARVPLFALAPFRWWRGQPLRAVEYELRRKPGTGSRTRGSALAAPSSSLATMTTTTTCNHRISSAQLLQLQLGSRNAAGLGSREFSPRSACPWAPSGQMRGAEHKKHSQLTHAHLTARDILGYGEWPLTVH